MDAGDLAGAARQVHAVVSSAGNVGARRLSVLARALEACAKSGDLTAARDMLGGAQDCLKATQAEIAAVAKAPQVAVA
ncbi:MAG: Hpt domain-containing protein [Pseudomonadota bacterium]